MFALDNAMNKVLPIVLVVGRVTASCRYSKDWLESRHVEHNVLAIGLKTLGVDDCDMCASSFLCGVVEDESGRSGP